MTEIKGFRTIEINLAQQRNAEFRGPSRQILIVSGVCGFLLILFLAWGFIIQGGLEDLDVQLAQGESEISQLQTQLQQMNANGRLDVWKDLPDAIRRENRPPLEIIQAIARHMPADATVNSWVLDGSNTLRCDIDFGSTESFIRFRTTISKEPVLRLLSMDSFINKPVGDGSPGNYLPVTTVNFVFEITPVAASAEGGQPS